jgi:hypothetical protein
VVAAFPQVQLFVARVDIAAALFDEAGREGPFHHEVVAASGRGHDYGSYLSLQRMLPCRRTWLIEWVCCSSADPISRSRAWSWTAALPPAVAEGFYADLISAKDRLIENKDEQLREAEKLVLARDKQVQQAEAQKAGLRSAPARCAQAA